MICEHLRDLEQAFHRAGMRETYRGSPWTRNCREWVYFDCYIDLAAVRQAHPLDACVVEHRHRGTHDGQEAGFECSVCHDAIMGAYEPRPGQVTFRG